MKGEGTTMKLSNVDRATALLLDLRRDVPGIRGVLLASVDGRPLCDTFASGNSFTSASAMIAAALGLGRRLAELVGDGQLQEATIRSTSGYVIVYAVSDVAVMTVLTNPGANVARIHLIARDVVKDITSVLIDQQAPHDVSTTLE